MTVDFQTIAALVVVAVTATWMIVRLVRRRKGGCADSGCGGCPTQELKR